MNVATAGSHNPYPVTPTGFLIGSYIAFALYGIHLTQIYHYFTTYHDSIRTRLLVLWILLLSTLQMAIILGSGWKYFVDGISDPSIWGTFLWPLSFQDGLIPMMAYTGQLYFGRRAWKVLGRKRWFGVLIFILPTLTMGCGLALAITARLWSDDVYVSTLEWAHTNKVIGVPSQIVAITWMGMSALVDGSITLILIFKFRPHRVSSPRLVSRLTALTLETVLLTHICGAAMCIIFLASNPAHRTDKDIFWVLIEIITELYALSMLFTINSRRTLRSSDTSAGGTTDLKTETGGGGPRGESMCVGGFGVSEVERRVEGYQGDTPFGVVISALDYYPYDTTPSAGATRTFASVDQWGSMETSMIGHASGRTTGQTSQESSGTGGSRISMKSLTSASSPPVPFTPQDEVEQHLQVPSKE